MGRKNHEIGRLCFTDPDLAAEKMRELFVRCGASNRAAASAVGCTKWTWKRWIRSLDLFEEFREVRDLLSMRRSDAGSGTASRP